MDNERANNSINAIQSQIEKFDSKANSLITIVGIVFAMSLGMIDVFINIKADDLLQAKYIALLVFCLLYFISFAIEMFFLIIVIYPRKKRKSDLKSLSYYLDVATMQVGEIEKALCAEAAADTYAEQISNNARICTVKHNNFVIAVWLLIPLFVFMFAMFFTAIIK